VTLTREQREELSSLAGIVQEGRLVGALVRELAALCRLRSVSEASEEVRADLERLLGAEHLTSGVGMLAASGTARAEAGAASAAETLMALISRFPGVLAASDGGGGTNQSEPIRQPPLRLDSSIVRWRMEAGEVAEDDGNNPYSNDPFDSEVATEVSQPVSPDSRPPGALKLKRSGSSLRFQEPAEISKLSSFVENPNSIPEGLEGLEAYTVRGSGSSPRSNLSGSASDYDDFNSQAESQKPPSNPSDSVYSETFLQQSGSSGGSANNRDDRPGRQAAPEAAAEGDPGGHSASTEVDFSRHEKEAAAAAQRRQQQQQQPDSPMHLPSVKMHRGAAVGMSHSSMSTLLDSILDENAPTATPSITGTFDEPAAQTITAESLLAKSASSGVSSPSSSESRSVRSDDISDDSLSTIDSGGTSSSPYTPSSSDPRALRRSSSMPGTMGGRSPSAVSATSSPAPGTHVMTSVDSYNRSPNRPGALVVSSVRRSRGN